MTAFGMARPFVERFSVALVCAASLLLLVSCGIQSTSKYRFRLQVELDTPQGRKTESSVIEVTVRKVAKVIIGTPESGGIRRTLRGQAIFFDMGGGRNLVAALTTGAQGEDEANRFERIAELAVKAVTGTYPDPLAMRDLSGSFEVPEEAWPTLITLADVDDGFSAKAVDPSRLHNAFGVGTRLISVNVTFTKEQPFFTIGKEMPFLQSQSDKLQRIYGGSPYVFKPQPYYFIRK